MEIYMNEQLIAQMKKDAQAINELLEKLYNENRDEELSGIIESMSYSLMAGGKRIRPIIALAFCRLFGGKDEAVLPYALALEMVHTASLIHDDLPCIDDDELRRGRPTNHVVFGESTALLAGDGLLMDAYGLIAKNNLVSAEINVQAIQVLSDCTGTHGLVGGEYIDVMGEEEPLSLESLKKMDAYKTGALIKASAYLGTLAAGVSLSDERVKDVRVYAENIGLAFQIVDDVLDVIGSAEELGKNPGADAKEKKSTYISFYSVDEATKYAKELTRDAVNAISKYENCEFLRDLAIYLTDRRN
jgi:geranylgeranyl diphosphate synthase type II